MPGVLCISNNYSYYSSSRYKNCLREMYLVSFDPVGSAESYGGTVVTIGSVFGKLQILRVRNARFVGRLCFEY